MGRESRPLPKGWEHPIPDALWPEAMIAAVRTDPGALASPRVIETIRRWQDAARDTENPHAQREAKGRLRALGAAIARDGAPERVQSGFESDAASTAIPEGLDDVYTVDSYRPDTNKKREVLRPADQAPDGAESTPTPSASKRSAPPSREFADEDEKPTTLRDSGPNPVASRGGGFYRAARIDPFNEEGEKPTASIPIPGSIARRSAAKSAEPKGEDDGISEPIEEQTLALGGPPTPAAPVPAVQAVQAVQSEALADPEEDTGDAADHRGPQRLAPKPGIVRRHAPHGQGKKDAPDRPRAAMQPVKALYAIVLPLCEELVPLNFERRSRRFWARWREIAGDRGVRREFVEELLASARDLRTMACELIAEVQSVDVKSVYVLVQKIEASDKPAPAAQKPVGTPERHRAPVGGAEVRVEAVQSGADEEK